MTKNTNLFAFALITSLFFLWSFAPNLDPILIPHLKSSFTLTTVQATLVDSSVRIGGGDVIAMDINAGRLKFSREKLNVSSTIEVTQENVLEQLIKMTGGDMPTVVIDATGNLKVINNAFQYMAHSARYVLIRLQKGDISFNHPEFHKREGTLMSSRNATREDFEHVVASIKNGQIKPGNYITHRVDFDEVRNDFSSWLDPANNVIKAMANVGSY
jgi:threonine dehydrogenase-like Zn-dependent dehydrogenase